MVTNNRHDVAKKLIEQEINAILMTPTRVKENGCVACHILFTLVNRLGISEAAASDQLSEILFHDQNLNEIFIDMVEKIHMKQRMMGVSFSLKSRDSKNRYINSQMKDGLYELDIDLVNYGKDIVTVDRYCRIAERGSKEGNIGEYSKKHRLYLWCRCSI